MDNKDKSTPSNGKNIDDSICGILNQKDILLNNVVKNESEMDTNLHMKKINAHFCEFTDQTKGQCRQRAINGFKYCIRHILLDSNAPYKQCQHKRKPKNKHDEPLLCTNAIKSTSNEIYCSTHLIMKGMKDPKTSKKELKANQTNQKMNMATSINNIEEDDVTKMGDFIHNPMHNPRLAYEQNERTWAQNSYFPERIAEGKLIQEGHQNFQLMKSQLSHQQIQIKSGPGTERTETSPTCISAAYPQLTAKLLQQTDMQKKSNFDDHRFGNDKLIAAINSFQLTELPTNLKNISIRQINESRNFQQSQHIISSSENFCTMSSPLCFLNNEPPPRHYDLDRIELNLSKIENEEENEFLNFQRDYSNDFDSAISGRKKKQKVIKLRQKRQKVRIDGFYRKIRVVDSMCRVIENYDFDRTDLFPLGLEPSDDESSSDDSFPCFDETHNESLLTLPFERDSKNRLELYLLKKKLRLESARLVQRAKLCIPINAATRQYVNSSGAALRIRKANKKKGNYTGRLSDNRLRQCAHIAQQQISKAGKIHFLSVRCSNFCLPWTRHCSEHISYNVAQQMFSYCKWRLCNTTIPITDAIVFDGFCKHHFIEQQKLSKHSINMIHSNKNHQFVQSDPMKNNQSKYSYNSFSVETNQNQPAENIHIFDAYPCSSAQRDDHLNDVVDGDVSLASVAKDLGFDGRELTDMLERLPVEEAFEMEPEPDEENLLSGISKEDSDEVAPGATLGHSWADVEQFLLEQEHHTGPMNSHHNFNCL